MRGRRGETTAGPAIYVRLPTETVADLDAWVEELRASVPGGSAISRSDVIRDLVIQAMADRKKGRKGSKR